MSIVPGIYDASLATGNVWIDTEDCNEMARKLAREEGLQVGISAAGNVVALALYNTHAEVDALAGAIRRLQSGRSDDRFARDWPSGI